MRIIALLLLTASSPSPLILAPAIALQPSYGRVTSSISIHIGTRWRLQRHLESCSSSVLQYRVILGWILVWLKEFILMGVFNLEQHTSWTKCSNLVAVVGNSRHTPACWLNLPLSLPLEYLAYTCHCRSDIYIVNFFSQMEPKRRPLALDARIRLLCHPFGVL